MSRAKPRQRHWQSTFTSPASRIHSSWEPTGASTSLGIVADTSDPAVELGVKRFGSAADDFEVGEHAAGIEHVNDLSEQLALAVIVGVMNREARDHWRLSRELLK